ncbi:MAG TPA: LysR substrate-binding domain-containing protein [Candidatus Dormibacteraeota bacterium]|nr:LysR substrate-binding domain-containing protein [Candidatus Dormibacteraeota bacterium]
MTGDGMDGNETVQDRRPRRGGAAPSQLERQLTLQQLRVFKSVVEHRNFTRAAEALFLTQPAVTHQVQALAKTMGQPLFTGRGATCLTPLGEIVYEKACHILADLRELNEAVEDVENLRSGTVRVAGDATFGTYILPRAVGAFRSVFPDVQVQLAVAHGSSIRDRLLRHEAELGVVGRLWQDSRIRSQPVMENVVACYCAPTHPLANRGPVELTDVAESVLLLREPGSGLSDAVQRLFGQAGLHLLPAMEIADNEARKRAAIEGLGVAVLSRYAVRSELAVGLLVPLAVGGFPVRQTWHAVWLKDRELPPSAEAFKSFLCAESWGEASH